MTVEKGGPAEGQMADGIRKMPDAANGRRAAKGDDADTESGLGKSTKSAFERLQPRRALGTAPAEFHLQPSPDCDDASSSSSSTAEEEKIFSFGSLLRTGPFQLFMDTIHYPGQQRDDKPDLALKAYLMWERSSRKLSYQDRYYQALNEGAGSQRGPPADGLCADPNLSSAESSASEPPCGLNGNDLSFKSWYVKLRSRHRVERVKVTAYFYWLGWYLKKHASPELLNKPSFQIALELGHAWNMMDPKQKSRWAALAARHKHAKGKHGKELPDWYHKAFY
ncbi:hypothetical protein PAPHI01_1635 [Pancytospora philotis]|nr:hypothetical protein PAPHI01_1635 [Pancytospora philotis]